MNRQTAFLILFLIVASTLFSFNAIPEANATTYYYLDISSNPVEGGTTVPTTGEHQYASGTYVTITAYPGAGYSFFGWLVDGYIPVYNNPWSFTISHNTTAIATFSELNVTLTILERTNGYTNPSDGIYTFSSGSNVSITAYPDAGYYLYNWEVNGGISQGLVGVNPLEFTIDTDLIIAPIFTDRKWFYVELLENVNGEASLNWGTYFVFDDDPYFTVWAKPDSGYKLEYWLINGTIQRTENPISVFINGNSTVQPFFTSSSLNPLGSLISLVPSGLIIGVLAISFSQVGDRLGDHAMGGFLIGGSMGLIICANAGLIPIWFTAAVFTCGMVAVYFWARSG